MWKRLIRCSRLMRRRGNNRWDNLDAAQRHVKKEVRREKINEGVKPYLRKMQLVGKNHQQMQ